MDNSFETNFIPETAGKIIFSDTPARNFFAKWCEINDSIIPQFISREAWEQRRVRGILEKSEEGKQILFLPEDLHLWEVADIIKTVDYGTFARKPEQREERAGQIAELGKTFEKAGIYLNKYLPDIKDGNNIAQTVSNEFYSYGCSLRKKARSVDKPPQDAELTDEDKQKLDEWFLGWDAYEKRMARLGKNSTGEQIEERRKKLLQVYFKALAREGCKADGEKSWKIAKEPVRHLQDRARRQITRTIEIPKREMKTFIFRRGVEELITGMKEVGWRKVVNNLLKKVGFDPVVEQRKLYDILQIEEFKQELARVRRTEDASAVSKKELQIARKIQKVICGFPYKNKDEQTKEIVGNNLSRMVETQFINCVGASILGGGLLGEVGIKYLLANMPRHSAIVLITSDGKVYWQDFTPSVGYKNNYEITKKELSEDKQTVLDIINFAKNPENSGLSITLKDSYNKKRRITLFNPETGLQCQIFNNTGNALNELGKHKEAVKAFEQAIDIDPNDALPYNGLGNALNELGKHKEAVKAFEQAIDIDPNDALPYKGLGNALNELGKHKEAVKAYEKFVNL